MIGIYKITNKLNGKSYIGQSIHCGKRLDEHYKGKQLIDEIIQLEGIENFTFEILKESDKKDLSYWEDYYIEKYNTMFPNGYNKRWNCNEKVRNKIRNEQQKKSTVTKQPWINEELSEEEIEMVNRWNKRFSKRYTGEKWIGDIESFKKFKYLKRKNQENRGKIEIVLPLIYTTEKFFTNTEWSYYNSLKKIIEKFNQKKSLWSYDTIIENYEEGPVTYGIYTTEQNYNFGQVEFTEEKIIIKSFDRIFIKMISKLFSYKDFDRSKIFFYLNDFQLTYEELIRNKNFSFDKIEISI